MESARVDRYLWGIRLCKTRSDATEACKAGHVDVNGRTVKPAHAIAPGDRIEARLHGRTRIVEVVAVVEKRVGAAVAATCYLDHSPPAPPRDPAPLFGRLPGSGRPTKRERRQLDRWRGSR
ncbi:MAG: RNA-binding S4 domain-containing protein [Acidimicrobiia bacterium]|nr:RNA-binding S4 domain-containing protein [Acidimicrobiia bacterium]